MVAVFRELQKTGDHELHFWCDKKFGASARGIFAKFDENIPVDLIIAGKLRRYHGKSISFHLYPSILFPNLRDGFKVMIGFFQSLFKLMKWRPDVIFIKGGYVCLPVGYAARLLRIVTGGGLGAGRINSAIVAIRENLLSEASVFLISGNQQYEEILKQTDEREGWRLQAFVHNGMAEVLAAADIVVTRAGATTLLELAALHKPTII